MAKTKKKPAKKVEMFRELTMTEAEQIGELLNASISVLNHGPKANLLNLNAKVGSPDCVTNTGAALREAIEKVAPIIGWTITTKPKKGAKKEATDGE